MIEGARTISSSDKYKRWIPSLILLPVCSFFLYNHGEYTFVDFFHLIVHEAGHAIFSFFGEFMTMIGGTLMQIIVPVLLVIFCLVNYLRVWLQLALFLLGHSFLNISVYAADARTMKLELFGPPGVKHDWNQILKNLDMLQYDTDIAMGFFVSAGIVFFLSLLVPFWLND